MVIASATSPEEMMIRDPPYLAPAGGGGGGVNNIDPGDPLTGLQPIGVREGQTSRHSLSTSPPQLVGPPPPAERETCSPLPYQYPLNWHQRTEHYIEDDPLQKEAKRLSEYADENLLGINKSKTKVMVCNVRKKYDVDPKICLKAEDEPLENVSSYKLLGLTFNENLDWSDTVNTLVKKAYKRLWVIRKLKILGVGRKQLIESFKQYAATQNRILRFGIVQ